jgi:hypothetical protein
MGQFSTSSIILQLCGSNKQLLRGRELAFLIAACVSGLHCHSILFLWVVPPSAGEIISILQGPPSLIRFSDNFSPSLPSPTVTPPPPPDCGHSHGNKTLPSSPQAPTHWINLNNYIIKHDYLHSHKYAEFQTPQDHHS